MGTELMRICVKEESDEFPAVPPGFESYSSFNVNQVKDGEKQENKREIVVALASQTVQVKAGADRTDGKKTTRPLRRRAGVKYNHHDCSEDELDIEKNLSARFSLPKGVVRGCPDCNTCQKVSARWHPEDARRPELDDAPVFHPTEEEFGDPLKYIASIRPKAEQYGICRIVPPSSWRPPCPLKEKNLWENSKFATRVQKVNKLQNRNSMSKMSKIHNQMRRKKRKCMKTGLTYSGVNENSVCLADSGFYESERFGFEPGPEFTLDSFQKYGDEFMTHYFSKSKNDDEMESDPALQLPFKPSLEDIEGEYWRIVEKPTEEIEVLYGADLETGAFGSGFPKTRSQTCSTSDERYVKSGWNLNNFPKLPGSVLCYESGDISGVLVPWLYIGMCFSSFCWHVEDHYLYSLNYMHFGASKMWYGVPGSDAGKLEEAMRKHLPDLFEEQPDLLHKLVTQLSPSILKSEGVPVYRCIQNAGEFVLTFPRAYHAGFNCGFNCAEAVNVAPVDWLPHGLNAVEQYRGQGRKTSVSHDKLLLGAAREAVRAHWELNLLKRNTIDNLRWKDVCGGDGILAKAFKTRVEMERVSRQFLCHSSPAVKMDTDFDATTERECIICLFDLHLSAAGCHCSPDKYACLNHAKQLCSCPPGSRFFLFRYDIGELNILVEALEGKLSAIYRWARMDLGLALSSYVSKDSCSQTNEPTGKISSKEDVMKGLDTQSPIVYMKLLLEKNLSSRNIKSSKTSNGSDEKVISSSQMKKEEGCDLDSDSMCAGSQMREHQSLASDRAAKGAEDTEPLVSVKNEVILLSDDEDEELEKPASLMPREACSEIKADPFKSSSGDDKPSSCHSCKDMVSTPSVSNSPSPSQGGTKVFPNGLKTSHLSDIGLNHEQNEGRGLHCHSQSIPSAVSSTCSEFRNTQDSSVLKETYNDVMETSVTANSGSPLQHSPLHSNEKPTFEDKTEICGTNVVSTVVNNLGSVSESSSFTHSNLDKSYRQKGPRIAKVVRRINCNVEPLEYGVVLPGKLWSNSKAIFPKGFRSRVRYISVLEPANMSFYVSEILDGEGVGPLFMAYLEHCPSEVFVHVSPTKCWDMVRERVNMEITKQHRVGRMNLPPLQPPGSLDGYEMFGFSSPAVVQAIEAMDCDRVCSDYWDSRPYSRPQIRILQHPQHKDSAGNCLKADTAQNISRASGNPALPVEVDTALRGLLKKADLEELRSLHSILSDARAMVDRNLLTRLLNEEIRGRPR